MFLFEMTPYDAPAKQEASSALADGFGRKVTYLRLSVTDRCDLRCVYCMAEHMRFLPKAEVLTLEELDRIASVFVDLGVRKLRLTGGEPALFARITRGGDLGVVQAGIAAAQAAGLKVKINVVALARDNAREIPTLVAWAHARAMDVTLIETMPMGEIDEDRTDQFLSLANVRADLEGFWTLTPLPLSTGGPARWVEVTETGGRLGFITPLTHNFCEGCNRVRLTCTGTLHTCLGQEDATDLRAVLRSGASDGELADAIAAGIATKPRGHDFRIDRESGPSVSRHMSTTGG